MSSPGARVDNLLALPADGALESHKKGGAQEININNEC